MTPTEATFLAVFAVFVRISSRLTLNTSASQYIGALEVIVKQLRINKVHRPAHDYATCRSVHKLPWICYHLRENALVF